jgi:hypothetical protein
MAHNSTRLFLSVFAITLSCFILQSQTIKGVIRDSKDNSILPFAAIELLETKQGFSSDVNGTFQFKFNVPELKIRISMVGYKTEEKLITQFDTSIVIYLTPKEFFLQAVTIYSENKSKENINQVSNLSLKSDVIKSLSTTFNDVFKTMQTLPGISVNNEMSAKFNVRGGNFDENLVLVNGTQVYEPFHIKEATNASVGIFNVDLMRKVDLITGGFTAEYGDKMSSVLKIDYREGSKEGIKGLLGLSLTDYDLLLEGPITEKSTFIIGARKSYVQYIMGLLNMDDRIHPSLYDIQGVAAYDFGGRSKLLFQFIHSGDAYTLDPKFTPQNYSYSTTVKGKAETFNYYEGDEDESNGKYYTTMLNLQWQTFLSNKTFMKSEAMFYYQYDNEYSLDTVFDRSSGRSAMNYFSQYKREQKYEEQLTIKTLEGKITINHQLNPFIEMKSGLSISDINYEQNLVDYDKRRYVNNIDKYPNISDTTINVSTGDEVTDYTKTNSYKFSGFVESVFQFNNIIFTLGGRFDYFDMNKDLTFSPRFNLSYKAGDCIFRFAYSHFYQSPMYSQFKYSYETASNTKSQKAIHYILGADIPIYTGYDTENNMNLKIEAFYKKYESLISSRRTTWWLIIYSKENDATGYAKGFDAQYNFSFKNLYGWISYGLLYTKEDILNDNKPAYPRYTDQRHTLSFVLDYKMGKGWDGNIRTFYGSGYAYTPYTSKYNTSTRRWSWIEGDKNSAYLPYYFRIDTKIGKQFSAWGLHSEVFLDIMNVLNTKNLMSYRYTFNSDGTPKREEIELFPIIPSLGLRAGF